MRRRGDRRRRRTAWRREGKTVTVVAAAGRLTGCSRVADGSGTPPARRSASLHRLGIEVGMLTGDNAARHGRGSRASASIAVLAEVLPEHKAAEVAQLQRQGQIVAMVGDGINDAPGPRPGRRGHRHRHGHRRGDRVGRRDALIKATLRGGAQPSGCRRATMRNIKQNLFFAFVYNALGIPIAAGLLYPFVGLLLSPIIASAAMAASSISVVLNALRLRRFRLPQRPSGAEPSTVSRPRQTEGTPSMLLPVSETAVPGGDGRLAKDPVCGMQVDPAHAAGTSHYRGQTVYFCSPSCKQRFDEDPQRYVAAPS
ncbi:MAG: hypothetical protein KatS3mg060_2325 [Dehalococcoidia bacterium]|nr:MAG: hypothetical protein KatS3mg060_2325 [Dehalococcoidia bacterium]